MSDLTLFADEAEVQAYKTQFAAALLREPQNAFKAATIVFGTDTGRALYASTRWLMDPFVMAERDKQLKTNGARAFLPTKEDYAREVWAQATNERVPVEDRARLLSLYGDVMGFKETARKNDGGITITNNKVMLVTNHGSDADWEARAAAQQHALANADTVDVVTKTLQ